MKREHGWTSLELLNLNYRIGMDHQARVLVTGPTDSVELLSVAAGKASTSRNFSESGRDLLFEINPQQAGRHCFRVEKTMA
ncbi:hypothetical protein RRG08_031812 [Elysia crispata]|uniref:Uncharacterized protein n=1 Tax=Elysia crispata TaxID=231223 RepID=A0AAE1CT23_9GAST|nr:hypothetical protein RRG08_031812 [Elysia crispata]